MCLMNVSSYIKAGGIYPLLMQSATVLWTLKEIYAGCIFAPERIFIHCKLVVCLSTLLRTLFVRINGIGKLKKSVQI